MRRPQTRAVRAKLGMMAGKKGKSVRARRKAGSAEPTHSEDGVDLTLIRWMLSLTPEDRLIILQENVRNTSLMLEGYRVPEFPRLIHVKGETTQERDAKKLAILRRTLEEKSRKRR